MLNNQRQKQHWLNELIVETQHKLRASLLKILTNEDVDDVIQEAYLKLFEIVESGKNVENAHALLFRIARNNAISKLRHKKVVSSSIRAVYDSDCERLTPLSNEDKIRQENEKKLITEAIATLPKVCRQVFILRKIENKSHSEISLLLGISPKTVENHITKAIKLCKLHVMKHLKSSSSSTPLNHDKQKVV